MGLNFVLDTNIVLYFLGGQLAETLPEGRYFVSVITEMELLSFPHLTYEEETQIRHFLSDISILPLTPSVKDKAIELRRGHTLKLPDAIIAASALTVDAELLTNDQYLTCIQNLRCRSMKLK